MVKQGIIPRARPGKWFHTKPFGIAPSIGIFLTAYTVYSIPFYISSTPCGAAMAKIRETRMGTDWNPMKEARARKGPVDVDPAVMSPRDGTGSANAKSPKGANSSGKKEESMSDWK